MKLAEVLSKPKLLAMQQDFIDVFPDDWGFKISGNGLKVTKQDDGPCWQEERMFYNPYTDAISRGEWEEVIRNRFESDMEQVDLPTIKCSFSNIKLFKGYCEADIQFESYVDALYSFILEEGGWDSWGDEPGDFGAEQILEFVTKHLTKGKK